ncbi:MAG: DUF6089 family protein, partial [Flavisolibacter sp.]
MFKLFFLLIGCFSSLLSFSQLQVGVFGGISNYQGDLVDKLFQKPKAAIGLHVSYQVTNRINIRGGFTFARVSGADSLNTKQTNLQARNLSFESPITEFSLVGEFNTFDLEIKKWSPYVFAGLAVFNYNPYTMDQAGNKVFLQPLGTEGQGLAGYDEPKLYALTQLSIPFGGGIKYNVTDNFRLAFELGLRKLFTDQLDDVSGNYADASELFAARGQRAVDYSYRGDEYPGGSPVLPVKGSQRG